jgi:hypothetical protein
MGRVLPDWGRGALMWNAIIEGVSVHADVDGILHLATLTVAVMLGYLGLDRIHGVETAFEDSINKVRSNVKDLLRQLGVAKTDEAINVSFIYDFPGMYTLCHVAGLKVKHRWPWQRGTRAVLRLWHVPLLGYFRARSDLRVISFMSVTATLGFLLLTAQTIWDLGLANRTAVGTFFALYVVMLLWIMFTVAASYRLRHIEPICKKLEGEVNARLDEVSRTLINRVQPPSAPSDL